MEKERLNLECFALVGTEIWKFSNVFIRHDVFMLGYLKSFKVVDSLFVYEWISNEKGEWVECPFMDGVYEWIID